MIWSLRKQILFFKTETWRKSKQNLVQSTTICYFIYSIFLSITVTFSPTTIHLCSKNCLLPGSTWSLILSLSRRTPGSGGGRGGNRHEHFPGHSSLPFGRVQSIARQHIHTLHAFCQLQYSAVAYWNVSPTNSPNKGMMGTVSASPSPPDLWDPVSS